MNCLEFRRLLGVEPLSATAEFVRHRHDCPRCAEAAARAATFEAALRRALQVESSPQLAESILLAQATRQNRQRVWLRRGGLLALAALLVLAVGIGVRVEAKPLSTQAVDHLVHEQFVLSWSQRVSADAVRKAFAQREIRLKDVPDDGVITFAATCSVGRYHSVHLVVSEDGEQVSVIYLVDKHVAQREDFEHGGWRGRMLPVGQGTLILIAHDTNAFDRVEQSWRNALQG